LFGRIAAASAWLALAVSASAQVSIDPNAPEPIRPIDGSLVIVGGGGTPQIAWDRFMELAGGENARLVVIPTASATADRDDGGRSLESWRARGPASVVSLHTRSRQTADDPEFVRPLTEATGVWFLGGQQSRITDAYLGTLVEKELRGVLARGGAIGGTSAGAAIMTEVMIAGGRPQATFGRGFGFLPGAIVDQHFLARDRQSRLMGLLASHPGLVGFGIDEGTAMIVTGGRRIEVVGRSTVTAMIAGTEDRPALIEEIQADPRATREEDRAGEGRARRSYDADLIAWSRAAEARLLPKFPAADPPTPQVQRGSLVIVGGGVVGDIWDNYIELAGGLNAKFVCIPTAGGMGEAENPRSSGADALRERGARNVTVLHTKSRERANNDEAFLAPLREADAVWFDGGRQWNLVDSYQNTTAHQLMLDVLARGGAIGGSSAGASIQGDYMARGDPRGSGPIAAEGYETGLGFLPGVAVDQHFHQRNRMPDMTGLMKRYPQILGIGIDERTAIVVRGRVAEVVGVNTVSFYDRRGPVVEGELDHEILRAGMKYDLAERRIIE
jgi:cyanophycinase